MNQPGWLAADWPAPRSVRAGTTTRLGGVSTGCYTSFNLARHVGDDDLRVEQNRAALKVQLDLKSEPRWLNQVHGCQVSTDKTMNAEADAVVTSTIQQACVVMTADCLPVLICDRDGQWVAAAHAGWRGLANGVIEATLNQIPVRRERLLAWLGPAIGPDAFEVGAEVRERYLQLGDEFNSIFKPHVADKWLMDIYQAARTQLYRLGVTTVFGGGYCTYSDTERFFSYRRDGQTGRMASLIWITSAG